MTPDDLIALELMLNRFNRLMTEVFRGGVKRNSFQPWEIDILLDMENCELRPRRRLEVLRQYQKAVQRQMQTGPGPPMKLSQYLERSAMRAARRREAAEAAAGGSSPMSARITSRCPDSSAVAHCSDTILGIPTCDTGSCAPARSGE